MNPSSHPAGLYQSSPLNSSASTLRPRAPRLISYLEDDHTAEATAISTSSLSPPPRFPSRGVSPSTSGNGARSTDTRRDGGGTDKPHNRRPSDSFKASAGGARGGGTQGLWESWSSIQGLASTLLGDVQGIPKNKTDKASKTPVWMKQDKRYGSKQPTTQWGPNSEPSTARAAISAPGAIEERQALVQAKKREVLLLANASENRDSYGRYKRRDSDAGLSSTTTSGPADSDADALVYLHKVQKEETLAGVIIKYNCQAEVFRKINRFWPNDNIQTRTHIVIPLEGCTVRGRKVDSPYLTKELFDSGFGLDQLSPRDTPVASPDDRGSSTTVNGSLGPGPGQVVDSNPSSLITSMSEETEFRHDSWVMLPNFNDAVEIVRVPRRALGYFPRPRRKSNTTTATDVSTPSTSTPKTSFDMLRHPPTHAAQTTASLNTSPVRRPVVTSRLSSASTSGRHRRSSSVTGGPFVEALRGPGGVGNLRGLRTEVARPGPADDPLNRNFAQYLPDLLPPPPSPSQQTPPLLKGLRLPTPRATTPRASTDSMRSTRSNSNSSGLGEVGGAIEGWVRKMAGVKRDRGAAVEKMGDLIELETNTEVGAPSPLDLNMASSSVGGSLLSRYDGGATNLTSNRDAILLGQRATAAATMTGSASASASTSASTSTLTSTAASTSTSALASASATDEALLNERFPLRGRVRTAYSRIDSSLGKDKDA